MWFDSIIRRYQQKRKSQYLALAGRFSNEFAFIGVGMHSIQNLYPALQHAGIPLRWIHSRTLSNAEDMSKRFAGAKATDKLDELLNDADVKGVFICASASQQTEIALRCLNAGKHCFIEKPVAPDINGWKKIADASAEKNLLAAAGHQRRFAPVYRLLKQRMNGVRSYVLEYSVGAYPEGDVLSEIFIHPLDLAVYLFGPAAQVHAGANGSAADRSIHLLLRHEPGITGTLILSAHGSWNSAKESLSVDTTDGRYTSENFRGLRYLAHPGRIMGLPLEKVKSLEPAEKILFSANGFLPQMSHNEISLAGYYDELVAFALAVSGNKTDSSFLPNRISDLKPVFELMDEVRGQVK